jgi:predicted ABC-type exoprotein transport system permease subunit
MQGRMFNVLLILHKMSSVLKRSEGAFTLSKESIESAHRSKDRLYIFFFGVISATAFTTSVFSLYRATQDMFFRVFAIVFGVLTLVLVLVTFLQYRSTNSQFREAEKISAQSGEYLASAIKEEEALDAELAQALAEWKELFPNDLASEPKSED